MFGSNGLLRHLNNYKLQLYDAIVYYDFINESVKDQTMKDKLEEDIHNGKYSYIKYINDECERKDIESIEIVKNDYKIVSDKIKYVNMINDHERKINILRYCVISFTFVSCYLLLKK